MEISEIVSKYNLKLLLTFGSYNTERYRPDSDIDVAYLSHDKLDVDRELQLLNDIALYFRKDRIDLVNLEKAVPLLMYEIANGATALYEENDSFMRFKLKAWARYADTKHLREKRRLYLNEKVEEYKISMRGGN